MFFSMFFFGIYSWNHPIGMLSTGTVCEAIFSLERRQIRVSNARRNWPSEVKPGRMECEGWKNDEKRQGSIVHRIG
jgi:hypothetical protein